MAQGLSESVISIRHISFITAKFQIIEFRGQIISANQHEPLHNFIFINKSAVITCPEKFVQVKAVKFSMFCNESYTVRKFIRHHYHLRQGFIRITMLTWPVCFGSLFVRVSPVVNLLLDKFAGVQCTKRSP